MSPALFASKKLSAILVASISLASSFSVAQDTQGNSLMKESQARKTRQLLKKPQAPLPTPATAIEANKVEKKWNGTLGATVRGRSFETVNNVKKTESRLFVIANINYLATPEIRFNINPFYSYINGYFQVDGKTDTVKNTISVFNAAVDFMPAAWVTTSVGALNQNGMHPGLIFDDMAFPAAKILLTTDSEAPFVASALAETAIVTSFNLSTETKDKESTPTFNSGGIQLKTQKGLIDSNIKVLAFQFSNLPSSMADDAGNVGNSTVQVGTNPKQFIYQYKGTLATGQIKLNASKSLAFAVTGTYIKNSEAPEGNNQGSTAKASMDADVSETVRLSPFYTYYRVEPDATVASLNDGTNTNRVGYIAGLALQYKKAFKASLSGEERDVVYTNASQQRERIWNLRLETMNVEF